MTTDDNANVAKCSINYVCKYCNYNTCKKTNYYKHLDTIKHKNNENNAENNANVAKSSNYMCKICLKHFNDRAGLWRHTKKCIDKNQEKEEPTDKELVMMLLQVTGCKVLSTPLLSESMADQQEELILKVPFPHVLEIILAVKLLLIKE